MATTKWDIVRLILRQEGIWALLARVVRSCLRPVLTWKTLVFFERDLTRDIPEIKARIPLEIRVASGEELVGFRSTFEEAGIGWDKIEPRVARGDRCAVGLSNGRVVHFRWMTVVAAWVPEIQCTVVPKPGEVYVYNSFTPANFRGRSVQPAISTFMLRWGQQQGYRRQMFYVRADNFSGLKIVGKIGARRTGTVRRFCFTGLKSSWITGLGGPESPSVELGSDASVRRLGPLGLWVRQSLRG